MKIYKHPEDYNNEKISDIYDVHLIGCESIQDPKEIEVMKLKLKEIANGISFKDYAQELIFRDAFIKGYLAAFVESDEEEKIKMSITSLGKAMKED